MQFKKFQKEAWDRKDISDNYSISAIIIFLHLIINLSLTVPLFIHAAYKNTVKKSLCS